jgi:hypothetical protein
MFVPRMGVEPTRPLGPRDFKSLMSTIPSPRHIGDCDTKLQNNHRINKFNQENFIDSFILAIISYDIKLTVSLRV